MEKGEEIRSGGCFFLTEEHPSPPGTVPWPGFQVSSPFPFLEPWGGGQPTTSLSTLAIQTSRWLPGSLLGQNHPISCTFPSPLTTLDFQTDMRRAAEWYCWTRNEQRNASLTEGEISSVRGLRSKGPAYWLPPFQSCPPSWNTEPRSGPLGAAFT